MPDLLSRTQIARLGDELRSHQVTPESEWWPIYEAYLNRCEVIREGIQRRVEKCLEGQGLLISGRTKTRDTLREKLLRNSTIKLGSIDDVIGIRVVGDLTLLNQDYVRVLLEREFSTVHKVKDRRANPVSGYRALHLIIKAEEMHVEIQIRTLLQSQWADLFERTADVWGRQIRYGLPPNSNSKEIQMYREGMILKMIQLSLETISAVEGYYALPTAYQLDVASTKFQPQMPTGKQFGLMSKKSQGTFLRLKMQVNKLERSEQIRKVLEPQVKVAVGDLERNIDEILAEIAQEVK